MTDTAHSDEDAKANPDAAAKEAAEEAVRQAREFSGQVVTAVSALDRERLIYLGSLVFVVICTLVFDMASFSVQSDHAVSETTAQAQRVAEARLNSWSYSAFTSCMWGKLMWLAALGGIVSVIYGAVTKTSAAWLPLSQIGLAAFTALLMLLIFAVGFPDLSAYEDASTSATLLGYWLPTLAALSATIVSVKRLL